MQLSSFADAPTSNPNNPLLSATLTWNSSGSSNNNGNLWNATYSHGGPGYPTPLTFTDAFTYDPVNRLQTATDSGGWSRSFAYDAYGNMTPSGNPVPPAVSFNANNQINLQTYDQTGNQLTVNGNATAYDFENRVTTETDGVTGAIENYVYDGDGHRVEQYGATPTTVFVYDAMGQLAAEYSTAATTSLCGAFCYLTTDHLGSTRLVTDTSGNVIARHDYLPFGEEVAANTFGRDTSWNPGTDFVNQKFTGKERDSAGLDYFGARYYGSATSRFLSPDEPMTDQDSSDPQSLNLYSYVRNNPLVNIDSDGRSCQTATFTVRNGDGNVIQQFSDADFADCLRPLNSFFGDLSNGLQSNVQTVNHFVNSVNWQCVSGYTATGMGAGAATGAVVGLAGSITGPGELVIEPASVIGGAALGGATGIAAGLNSCMSSNGNAGGGGEQASGEGSPEKKSFWKSQKPFRGKTKTNGLQGKAKRFFEWDHTHGDVEVYDSRGQHLGSANPETGDIIKPAVPGRRIDI